MQFCISISIRLHYERDHCPSVIFVAIIGHHHHYSILESLHRHGAPVVQHRLVHRPQALFPRHLCQCPHQILQLKLLPPVRKHQLAYVEIEKILNLCFSGIEAQRPR
ncbi:hypothetical protein ACFX11_041399 [Malus domestica]